MRRSAQNAEDGGLGGGGADVGPIGIARVLFPGEDTRKPDWFNASVTIRNEAPMVTWECKIRIATHTLRRSANLDPLWVLTANLHK